MLGKALKSVPIIPVVSMPDENNVLKLAELYLSKGIKVIEITLRFQGSFGIIRSVRKNFPEMVCGAGSVLSTDDCARIIDCDAQFCVSPMLSFEIGETAAEADIMYVPGVATPTELYQAMELSSMIKIFPAASLGGVSYIKSIIAPFKQLDFSLIPTGGISEKNLADYLSCDRVAGCGMSYIADKVCVERNDFEEVSSRIAHVLDIYRNLNRC